MTQQIINVGNVPNDGEGDPIRTAFIKTNENFTELYNIGGITGIANGNSNINIAEDSVVTVSATGVANVLVISSSGATLTGTFTANSQLSATGNITSGGFYIGNGSQLTGVISSAPANLITGNTLSANVVNSSLTAVGILTSLSVSGNVTGGNILTGGQVAATGNVSGQNINTVGEIVATGNVSAASVNLTGLVSAAGNVTSGGNVSEIGRAHV